MKLCFYEFTIGRFCFYIFLKIIRIKIRIKEGKLHKNGNCLIGLSLLNAFFSVRFTQDCPLVRIWTIYLNCHVKKYKGSENDF